MNRVEVLDILAIQGVSEIAVAGNVNAWSYTFDMPIKRSVTLEAKFESGGVVDVDAYLEVGNEDVGTEGTTDANYGVPVGDSAIIAGAAAQVYHGPFTPTVGKKGRIKLAGQAANAATTKVTRLRILMAEEN